MKLPRAWTAQPASAERCGGYRHFTLVGERGRGRQRLVELEAVLERGFRLLVPASELRDRDAWLPGWRQLPAAVDEPAPPADAPDPAVARRRARLLEFLKFRVLAAQESFFADLREDGGERIDPERFRRWLGPVWPEALALDDEALLATLGTARDLYVDGPS